MLTDLTEIKQRLSSGYTLRNRGKGWALESHEKPSHWSMADTLHVSDAVVALLTAQGHIKTELRLVGSAQWVKP